MPQRPFPPGPARGNGPVGKAAAAAAAAARPAPARPAPPRPGLAQAAGNKAIPRSGARRRSLPAPAARRAALGPGRPGEARGDAPAASRARRLGGGGGAARPRPRADRGPRGRRLTWALVPGLFRLSTAVPSAMTIVTAAPGPGCGSAGRGGGRGGGTGAAAAAAAAAEGREGGREGARGGAGRNRHGRATAAARRGAVGWRFSREET